MFVSVNVYSKSTLTTRITAITSAPFAGHDFSLVLTVSDRAPGQVEAFHVIGRLVGPEYSIGNAYLDEKTIPVQSRRKYIDPENPEAPFNEVRYASDYEALRPGIFPVRDQDVIFTRLRNGVFHAHVEKNLFPGILRIAVRVVGTLSRPNLRPQRFSRILQTQVALGILPDPKKTKPTLHWLTPKKFLVAFTPTDRLGNVASPVNLPPPTISVNGVKVKRDHINPYAGEQQLEVEMKGDAGPSIDGRKISDGTAIIETLDGRELTLKDGEKLDIGIDLFNTTLDVTIPQVVGDKNTRKAYGAGTEEAMNVAQEDRETFNGIEKANKAGYVVVTKGLPNGGKSLYEKYHVSITLNEIKIIDDNDLIGDGEMSFTAHVIPSRTKSEQRTTRLPGGGKFYSVSDCSEKSTLTINQSIFEGVIGEEQMTVHIGAIEHDLLIFKTELASYKRVLRGHPMDWNRTYQPGDEPQDREVIGDWSVKYTVKVKEVD